MFYFAELETKKSRRIIQKKVKVFCFCF